MTTSYDYDSRNQLTNDSVHTYTYDPAGNRTSNGSSIGTGNRLQSDNDWSYTYDDEGNLTRKVSASGPTVTWTYAYDVMNRLTSVLESGGGNDLYAVTYAYDVFGDRIQEQEDADGAGAGTAVTNRYALDGLKVHQDAWQGRDGFVGTENWDVWADLDGSNNLKVRYVRGNAVDELFTRVKSDGTVAWYLTDRMQSVRQMTDAGGALQDTVAYDAFGNVTSETGPTFGDRYKWTGRELSVMSQLQYNRQRYYSNNEGRWTSIDPLGFYSSEYNLTRYSGNNSQNTFDPSGLFQPTDGKDKAKQPPSVNPPKYPPIVVPPGTYTVTRYHRFLTGCIQIQIGGYVLSIDPIHHSYVVIEGTTAEGARYRKVVGKDWGEDQAGSIGHEKPELPTIEKDKGQLDVSKGTCIVISGEASPYETCHGYSDGLFKELVPPKVTLPRGVKDSVFYGGLKQ